MIFSVHRIFVFVFRLCVARAWPLQIKGVEFLLNSGEIVVGGDRGVVICEGIGVVVLWCSEGSGVAVLWIGEGNGVDGSVVMVVLWW